MYQIPLFLTACILCSVYTTSIVKDETKQINKNLVKKDELPPRLGRDVPRLGREVPRLGREVPRLGREVHRHRREVPRFGREVPRLGREVPRFGREVPRFGREVPRFGREVPRFGRNVDENKNSLVDLYSALKREFMDNLESKKIFKPLNIAAPDLLSKKLKDNSQKRSQEAFLHQEDLSHHENSKRQNSFLHKRIDLLSLIKQLKKEQQ